MRRFMQSGMGAVVGAGLGLALAALHVAPVICILIVLAILAFGAWRTHRSRL